MTFQGSKINPSMIKFDTPNTDNDNIIKVIGVGGGGSNAVNHMYAMGIAGVDFVVCNTDSQALSMSAVPLKIQLGQSLTEGRGAGSIPAVGRNAAIENIDDIRHILDSNTKMLFITAGMGGGTGTGAAPVIASVARDLGILTVGIVTIPFSFEGRKRKMQAEEGIKELKQYVDSLLVICNDRLRELHGDLTLSKAFGKADNILTTAAKGIAEIITITGYINVDFTDVETVMKNSGVAIMGSGMAEGENRAIRAVEEALNSPLLNDNDIDGAKNILLYIASGLEEILTDEVTDITDYIQKKAGQEAEIIWGTGRDESLENKISVTLVATGFETNEDGERRKAEMESKTKVVGTIDDRNEQYPRQTEVPSEIKLDYTAPSVTPLENEIKIVSRESEEESEPVASFEISSEEKSEPVIFNLNESYPPEEVIEPTPEQNPDELHIIAKAGPIAEPEFKTEAPARHTIDKEPSYFPVNKFSFDRFSQDRIKQLKDLSLKLKSSDDIDRYEREPAYVRRETEIIEPKHSSESDVSQFTVAKDGKNGVEIMSNNAFLHDNPD
jgi:cell division protein FtsZ